MFLDYLEALADLSEQQLEYGCSEASKTAEFFPWPGTIRKLALQHNVTDQIILSGPKQLEYNDPPLTDEEKKQAEMDSLKLRVMLAESHAGEMPRRRSPKEQYEWVQEQKRVMREKGYLQ